MLNHDVLNSSSETKPEDREVLIRATVHGVALTCTRRNLNCTDELPDTYLFEPDYTLAASTGFLLWPGSWVLMRHLSESKSIGDLVRGKRCIELGSGIGLAGLGAAAAGAHCLLTDLPSVVHGVLDGNIVRNGKEKLQPGKFGHLDGWSIGSEGGTASSLALDWTSLLAPQLTKGGLDLLEPLADILLAVDVVWLKELLNPFRATCAELLSLCSPGTVLLLTYIDRSSGKEEGSQFSSRNEVAAFFTDGGEVGMEVESFLVEEIQVDDEVMNAEVFSIKLKA